MNNGDVALINGVLVAVAAIFASLGALAGSWYATRTSAKTSELNTLRERVDALSRENIRLHEENIHFKEYVAILRTTLREHGIDVPRLEDCV